MVDRPHPRATRRRRSASPGSTNKFTSYFPVPAARLAAGDALRSEDEAVHATSTPASTPITTTSPRTPTRRCTSGRTTRSAGSTRRSSRRRRTPKPRRAGARPSSTPPATGRSRSGPSPSSRQTLPRIGASPSAATRLSDQRKERECLVRRHRTARQQAGAHRARPEPAADVQGRGLRTAAGGHTPEIFRSGGVSVDSNGVVWLNWRGTDYFTVVRSPQVQDAQRSAGDRPALPGGLDGAHQAWPDVREHDRAEHARTTPTCST